MNLRTIALNNLRRRKARLAFLMAGLLIGVATVVTLLSLTTALTAEARHKMDTYGANILLTPRQDALSLTYGEISLGGVTVDPKEIPQADLERISTIPNRRNISVIAPKVLGAVTVRGERVLLMGVDPQEEFLIKQWWSVDGRPMESDSEVVLGAQAARRLAAVPGSTIEILEHPFAVTGVLRETGSEDDALVIATLPMAQRLLGKEATVSLVEIAAMCSECPVEEIVQQISAVLPDLEVNALQQVVKTRMFALEQFRVFSLGVAIVVVLIGALMVFITMMGSVRERTREIGIFRALGFRRRHVASLVLMEAGLASIVAGALGYVIGVGAAWLILPLLSANSAAVAWIPVIALWAILLSFGVGSLASIYPALHASRLDPAEALRAL